MTKSTRHKKLRKQEKAKTQLTGVKKLSKPKNVVDPTLRVKKILIREQLSKSSSSELTNSSSSSVHQDEQSYTRRKQSIQDLLTSSNHHNVNIRKDALVGLEEIASSQFNTVIRNLDKVLARVAALTSDGEQLVRKENLKLATIIISKVSSNQLRPFWNLLVAHLKCTMTHLVPSVRYSALPFMLLLVEHHPSLVSESSSVILPSVLGLISNRTTTTTQHPSASLNKVEIITSKQQHDLTARLNVIRLLSKCVRVICSSGGGPSNISRCKCMKWTSTAPVHLGVVNPVGYSSNDESTIIGGGGGNNANYSCSFYSTITSNPFSSPFSNTTTVATADGKPESFWSEFTSTCVPVLIHTWVECGPGAGDPRSNKKKKQRSDMTGMTGSSRRNGLHILNESAVDSLLCIATLLTDLIHRDQHESMKTFQKDLGKYFFSLMPYVSMLESRKHDVTSANLMLFAVAGELKMFDREMKTKLQSFVEGLMDASSLDKDHVDSILRIIKFLHDHELATTFLIHVIRLGYGCTVSKFLSGLIHPGLHHHHHQQTSKTFIESLKWGEIVNEMFSTCSSGSASDLDGVTSVLDLLTFVALRRLIVGFDSVLVQNVPCFKQFIKAHDDGDNDDHGVRDKVHRVFFYSNAEECIF